MKKTMLTVFAISVIIATMAFSTSSSGGSNCSVMHSASAPSGYCGDPVGGNKTCNTNGCHSAGPTPTTQTGWITSNIPGTGYVPGTTYTIIATATRANHTRFGFEISPQNSLGVILGTLLITDATNTQFTTGNTNYVTHTSAGTIGTTGFHTWMFNWTAPASGSGNVTFYGAFNVTNSSNNAMGDTIYKSTLTAAENTTMDVASLTSSSELFSVYPNPVSDKLNITYSLKETAKTEIKITDMRGRIVDVLVSENKAIGAHSHCFNLDRTKYARGFYFVTLSAGEKSSIKKILVE